VAPVGVVELHRPTIVNTGPLIAYFSMEIAVHPAMPTYAGGLGVLAGDTLRSCADAGVPIVAVTLLHRKGYLTQSFDQSGWQREAPTEWEVKDHLVEMPQRVAVQIEDRIVSLRSWRYELTGLTGAKVPVYFLDTDITDNPAWDRTLTHSLYGGDAYYRLGQEIVLGIGGVRMLRALGFARIDRFHLNEGHASLLCLELLREAAHQDGRPSITKADIDAVRARCIFTTHTPVAAGHDQFPMDLVGKVFSGRKALFDTRDLFCAELVKRVVKLGDPTGELHGIFVPQNTLNLTYLALALSHFVNGVANRHAEVARQMFGKDQIDAISNGVHAATWTSEGFRMLFDRYIPGWRSDNFSLRYALSIPATELWEAHIDAKSQLLAYVREHTGVTLDLQALTIGSARRATAYKRPDLLLTDVERLKSIAASSGKIQVIFAGKAHPNDSGGKEAIQRILRMSGSPMAGVRILYLSNYELNLARLLTAGVDVWLNTPLPPLEASGTSGMKAALNGVPSLSVLDGWWLEGCIEGATGWAIGNHKFDPSSTDSASLYEKLENVVVPLFYRDRARFIHVMRQTIALNGSFFNTQRMVQEYVLKAYSS
jgi:starch phosphorylase